MPIDVTLQRWEQLCVALDILPDRHEFTTLVSAYSQPHRYYHTLQHLGECLEQLDWAIAEFRYVNLDCFQFIENTTRARCSHSRITPYHFKLIEISLWYHDVIYQPRDQNNEQKSADLAAHFLSRSGLNSNEIRLIWSSILATEHRKIPVETIHQFVVDIDLSILGAEVDRFQEYDLQICQEYAWVTPSIYRQKRKEVLSGFLSKHRIYVTDLFYRKFEKRARENLKRAIEQLSSS